jgi:hypothetical protein
MCRRIEHDLNRNTDGADRCEQRLIDDICFQSFYIIGRATEYSRHADRGQPLFPTGTLVAFRLIPYCFRFDTDLKLSVRFPRVL